MSDHVKDVSPPLAAATRGKQTGIAVSHCALGEGVNAGNIKKCPALLRDHGYSGALSMDCEGQGGPMIERLLKCLRGVLAELGLGAGQGGAWEVGSGTRGMGVPGGWSNGLSAAVAILEPEKGLKLIENTPGAAAFVVRMIDGKEETHQSRR
jgi:hypothetical protein